MGTWDNPESGYCHNSHNENEVFIPDQLKCKIVAAALDPDDKLKYKSDKVFQLQVIGSRTPYYMYTGCK